jgi:hypothetical protein
VFDGVIWVSEESMGQYKEGEVELLVQSDYWNNWQANSCDIQLDNFNVTDEFEVDEWEQANACVSEGNQK